MGMIYDTKLGHCLIHVITTPL